MSVGFGKASRQRLVSTQMTKMDRDIKILYGLSRTKHTPQTIQFPIFGSGAATPNTGNDRLMTKGDTMIGPIAFFPISNVFVTAGNIIDISPTGSFTTYVALQAGFQTIKTIQGAIHDGQLLILQGGGGTTTIDNSGNISPINASVSYTWSGNDSIILVYYANFSRWMQVTSAGNIGTFANTSLSNLTTTSINQDLIPNNDWNAGGRVLGSATKRWLALYVGVILFQNGRFIDISTNNSIWNVGSTETIQFYFGSTLQFQFDLSQGLSLYNHVRIKQNAISTFIDIQNTNGLSIGINPAQLLSFYGHTPITQPVVSGSRGGNTALTNLLTALNNLGLIFNNSSP